MHLSVQSFMHAIADSFTCAGRCPQAREALERAEDEVAARRSELAAAQREHDVAAAALDRKRAEVEQQVARMAAARKVRLRVCQRPAAPSAAIPAPHPSA